MSKNFFVYSMTAVAAVLIGLASPATAHEHPKMCNGVLDGNGEPVLQSDSDIVLHAGSIECPVAAAEVAPVAVTEPVAAGPLPHDGTVHFEFDVAALEGAERTALDDIIAELKTRNAADITVNGYADRSGGDVYNDGLSKRRADYVASQLSAAGIAPATIDQVGHGERDLAVETEDGVALRANRRVVIETTP